MRLIGLALLGLATPAFGQVAVDVPPVSSAKRALPPAPRLDLPGVDGSALEAQDALDDLDPTIPWRYGVPVEVDVDPSTHGVWTDLPDGGRLWRVTIHSPGAAHLDFWFDRYRLPDGARLWLSSEITDHQLGAFTSTNNQAAGSFRTSVVRGDTVTLEYYEPADAAFPGILHLDQVMHGYRDLFGKLSADKSFGSSEYCNVNVACPESAGHEDQIRSAFHLIMGGSVCSGALVNNTSGDGTPYLLTANHCTTGDSATTIAGYVAWFNWQSPTCGDPSYSPDYDAISGMSLVATRASSDFTLLRATGSIPTDYDVFYAGLDHRNVTPSWTFGVHHPAGDIKKYSEDFNPPTLGSYSGGVDTHWVIGDWDVGTTEGGSSGSPLFNQNGNVIGQLHGGTAACGNDEPDYYGALHRSWSDGDSATSRLVDHLDPLGSSTGIIPGRNGVVGDDAAVTAVVSPTGFICSGEVTPVITLLNNGADALTSVELVVEVDGGSPVSSTWTGSLLPGESQDVELPPLSLADGLHELTVSASAPNGGTDVLVSNDASTGSFTVAAIRSLPFAEDFASSTFPPSGWFQVENELGTEWVRAEAGSGAIGSAMFDNFAYDETSASQGDLLISPPLDLTAVTYPALSFDVAYAEYGSGNPDGLTVYVSPDCGASFSPVIDLQGPDLSSTGTYETEFFVPDGTQWANHQVGLDSYVGNGEVLVVIENAAGYGNVIYVDNVEVTEGPGPVPTGGGDEVDDLFEDCGCATGSPTGAGLLLLPLAVIGLRRRRA